MKDLKTVMNFTIKDMVKRKSFIISTLIILILIVLGFNIPNIISLFSDETENANNTILIIDSQNIFEGTLDSINQLKQKK